MKSVNVCFRVWPNGDVIAFIAGYRTFESELVMAYEHVGQHGEAHQDLIDELKPVTPEQYADLKEELESIGYVVNVVDDIRDSVSKEQE